METVIFVLEEAKKKTFTVSLIIMDALTEMFKILALKVEYFRSAFQRRSIYFAISGTIHICNLTQITFLFKYYVSFLLKKLCVKLSKFMKSPLYTATSSPIIKQCVSTFTSLPIHYTDGKYRTHHALLCVSFYIIVSSSLCLSTFISVFLSVSASLLSKNFLRFERGA